MSEAGIVDIPWPFYLEPSLARIFAASTRRVALRTRYNNNSADTHTEIIWGQLLHRFKHYRRWMLGR